MSSFFMSSFFISSFFILVFLFLWAFLSAFMSSFFIVSCFISSFFMSSFFMSDWAKAAMDAKRRNIAANLPKRLVMPDSCRSFGIAPTPRAQGWDVEKRKKLQSSGRGAGQGRKLAGQLLARDLETVQVSQHGDGDGFGPEEFLGELLQLFGG